MSLAARAGEARLVVLLALALALPNAAKPLHIDDGCYWQYARHIASEPFDPYGFDSFTVERPEPANETIAPPGLPYWWALGIRLFGERPFLWKLWLLPYCLLFAGALVSLLRRFARGLERPLAVMLVLSPVVLPALNLMLDIPALGLSLSAFVLFLGACDERAPLRAAAAGVVLSLACQTKYTGLLLPPILLAYALLFRRLRLWLLTSGIAAALFVSWEIFIALRYGRSHFVYHYYANHAAWSEKLAFGPPLLSLLGALAGGVLLLALAALHVSRARIALLAALVAVGFAVVALLPEDVATLVPSPGGLVEPLTVGFLIFSVLGAAVLAAILAAALRLLRPRRRSWRSRAARTDLFLVSWLLLELLGYFAMSPFPAARRVLGLVIASTVVCGRLASRTLRAPGRRHVLRPVVAWNAALALLFFGVDLHEARVTKSAAEDAARYAAEQKAPGARVFYVGHWGFQYYAERAGMHAAVDRQFYRRTLLRAGDFLVVPGPRIAQQRFWIDPERAQVARVLRYEDALPLRTSYCYYLGRTPLERHDGPRVLVTIYRVTDDFPRRPYKGSERPRTGAP